MILQKQEKSPKKTFVFKDNGQIFRNLLVKLSMGNLELFNGDTIVLTVAVTGHAYLNLLTSPKRLFHLLS